MSKQDQEANELAKEWCDENVPKPRWDEWGKEESRVDINDLNYRLRGFFHRAYTAGYEAGRKSNE